MSKRSPTSYTHIFAEFHPKRFCKRLLSLLLSSSNVDKLKMLMAFQLSTTDHLKLVSQFASYLQPLHSKASRAVIFGWTRQPSLTLPRWSVRCRRNIYKLQKFQVIVQHIYYIKFTLRFADMQIPELVSVFNSQVQNRG